MVTETSGVLPISNNVVPDNHTKKQAVLHDDITEEVVEDTNVDRGIQDIEKVMGE